MGRSGSTFAALAGLPAVDAESYAARLQHLWILAEQLRPIGHMLKAMGPLAPPCIAMPYAAMRENLIDSAGAILDEIRSKGSAEQWAAFERTLATGKIFPKPEGQSGGLVESFRSLAELKVFWSTAPAKWWGMTTAPTSQGGLKGFDDVLNLPRLPPAPSASLPGVAFTRAAEVTALTEANTIWRSPFWRAVRSGGSFFGRAASALFVVQMAWKGAGGIGDYFIGVVRSQNPSAGIIAQVDATIRAFNFEFVPKVVQQLTAATRAIKSAGVNPAALLPALLAVDPWSEKPAASFEAAIAAGADGDVVNIGDATKFHRSHPWLALGVFVGGTFADLALGME